MVIFAYCTQVTATGNLVTGNVSMLRVRAIVENLLRTWLSDKRIKSIFFLYLND